jgi:nucleoside-diphosphate-sugar epimerase
MKSILVTGSNGLLGKKVVEALLNEGNYVTGVSIEKKSKIVNDRFQYICMDLSNICKLEKVFEENEFLHVIHLAAIAHVVKGVKISWSKYYRVNTLMSRQIFECATRKNIPVFFSSTVDVYGIQNGEVDETTVPIPIGSYAKSKYLAENYLMELAKQPYVIARFAPIYTEDNKKDIRKRYYIKYPKLCYLIGDGMEYEFLPVNKAVHFIVNWLVNYKTMSGIINVCDDKKYNTKELIKLDKENGLAPVVLKIPKWLKKLMYVSVDVVFSKKPFFKFTAYKVIKPISINRSCSNQFSD